MDLLYLRNARQSVHGYTSFASADCVICESQQAVDCMDCEAFIECGIASFRFLMHASEKVREAVYDGKIEFSIEFENAILALVKDWLTPVAVAEQWIARCLANGYSVEKLSQFRECVDEARALVGFDQERAMSAAAADLRDRALQEHQNGETVEMFSETQ